MFGDDSDESEEELEKEADNIDFGDDDLEGLDGSESSDEDNLESAVDNIDFGDDDLEGISDDNVFDE